MQITGTVITIFGNDINTDDIIPAWTLQESTDRSFFKKYAFANYDSCFVNRCAKNKNNIIIAGDNFGCGSSREQAIYALTENNVVCVIAKSYPDIFYRNALNNGLTLIKLDEITAFKCGKQITIDLEKRHIIVENKTFAFQMSDEDAETFSLGGKIGNIKNHLKNILSYPNHPQSSQLTKSSLSQTIVEKIVSGHVGKPVKTGDKIDKLPIDILFFNEVIGPAAIRDFLQYFQDVFKELNKPVKVFDPKRVFFIPDHTVPSASVAVSEGITHMEEFARQQGIFCYKEGDGIEHVVLAEDGHIVPGSIILGTDSHTDTNGAFNTLSFGIGTTDGAYALATGHLYDFEVPATIRINLKGRLKKGVYAKDVILSLIGQLGVDGASRQVLEIGGEGLKSISMEGRATMSNMAVEMGARTAIFEPDKVLFSYYHPKLQQRMANNPDFPNHSYLPDKNCTYTKTIAVDLSSLKPVVAFPHKPSNVIPVSQIRKCIKITDAFIGSCTNGRYEDFIAAAKVLRGKKVHNQVNLIIIPASRKIYNRLLLTGILEIFAQAGANIESPNCGPCFGKHMGIVGAGAKVISTANRNYIGRMGSKDAKIFLASPATVAASAINGEVTDPRDYL